MKQSSMNPMLLTLAGLCAGLFVSSCKTTGSGDGTLTNPLKSTTNAVMDKAKGAKEKTILLTKDAADAAKNATNAATETAGKAGDAAKGAAGKATDAAKGAADAAKGAAGKATDAASKATDAGKSGKQPATKKPAIAGKLDSLLEDYEKKLAAHQAKLADAKGDARRELQTPIALDLAGFTKNWYGFASDIPKQLTLEQITDYSNKFKVLSGKYDDQLSKLVAGQ